MGYDLHIVKTRSWLDADSEPLTRPEVERAVQSHPEMKWTAEDEIEWNMDGAVVILSYDGSQLVFKSPVEAQILELVRLARQLGAFVIGDDGERYDLTPRYFGLFGPPRLKISQPR